MRILPVNLFKIQKVDYKNNTKSDYSYYRYAPSQDTVNFCSQMSAKKFAAIGTDMPDLYTGEAMLSHTKLNKMKQRGFFQGPIKDVVKKLGPYKEKYLKFKLKPEFEGSIDNIELEVFEKIEEAAKKTPNIDLTELFKRWYHEAYTNLRKEQKPYFDEIKTLGAELPQDKLEAFYNFMLKTDRQLYDVPIHHRFSAREFAYQAEKIIEKVPNSNGFKEHVRHELSLLTKPCVHEDMKPLTDSVIREVFKESRTSENHISKLSKEDLESLRWKKEAARIAILENIKESAEKKGLKRLERLCDANIKMVRGEAVQVPFSNKVFMYELGKIIDDIPNKELSSRMMRIAAALPTSSKSVDAFIIKLKDADPNTIGDRLFQPALKSIEHIVPASKGGETMMTNCALARKGMNTLRGNAPLWTFLRYFPVENQYKYALSLVRLNHKGKVQFEDAMAHLTALEQEGSLDLSRYKEMLVEVPSPIFKIKIKHKNKH